MAITVEAETFAKPSDVDAVQGVAAQRVQTYHVDRQTGEQPTTQKCAADGGFAKVSGRLKSFFSDGLLFDAYCKRRLRFGGYGCENEVFIQGGEPQTVQIVRN